MPSLPTDPPTLSVPTCATAFLYELNGMRYYETVDCQTGATGWGVTTEVITEFGCHEGECRQNAIITPTMYEARSQGTPSKKHALPFPGRRGERGERRRRRRIKRVVQQLQARVYDPTAPSGDLAQRRQVTAAWLEARLDNERIELSEFQWDVAIKELRKVAVYPNLMVSGSEQGQALRYFATRDRELYLDDGRLVPTIMPTDSPDVDSSQNQRVRVDANNPEEYVKAEYAAGQFAYFRLFVAEIKYKNEDAPPPDKVTALIRFGQEIDEEDIPGPVTPADAHFTDRHAHFHLLRIGSIGVANTGPEFLVYSPTDLTNSEYLP